MKNFKIKDEIVNNVSIIYPLGHLDAGNAEKFEKSIFKQLQNGYVKIIIECSKMKYISSAAQGVIIGYLNQIRLKGGDIVFVNVTERNYEIFDLVGFTEVFEFFNTLEEAISYLTKLNRNIAKGMSFGSVLNILGKPLGATQIGKKVILDYLNMQLIFIKNKLVGKIEKKSQES